MKGEYQVEQSKQKTVQNKVRMVEKGKGKENGERLIN